MAENQISLIDAVFDTERVMTSARYRIHDVAVLLDEVGMTRLADRLFAILPSLKEQSEILLAAHGDNLSANLRDSQELTGNLLLLALKQATDRSATQ